MCIQSKVVSRFEKWNEHPAFSSCPIYKSYTGQTNQKWNESELLVWAMRRKTIYLLGPEPRAALHHATPLYTALGDTMKKVVELVDLFYLHLNYPDSTSTPVRRLLKIWETSALI